MKRAEDVRPSWGWGRTLLRRATVVFIAVLVLTAVFAPWLTPHDPLAQNLMNRLQGPTVGHWLGTDEVGRDVLSRLLAATRVSLGAALLATAVAVVVGVPAGLLAGYLGRGVDMVLSRIADAFLAIPGLILAIAVVAALGPGLGNAMVAVGLVYAPGFFRVARACTITARDATYVQAAITTGCSTARVLGRHILPNIAPALLVRMFLTVGYAILAEAGLSYLGLGVRPPEASWGAMLRRAIRYLDQAPALVVLPGVAILLTVLAVNAMGDRVRDRWPG